MSSISLQRWLNERCSALDEIESAHASVGGSGRGRRYATQQLNYAYAVLLASQFQAYCRDLYAECADHMTIGIVPEERAKALRGVLGRDRKLNRGNANSGNIGSDFSNLGVPFWQHVSKLDMRNDARRELLDELNDWRNAIAHHDFTKIATGATLHLHEVRAWRSACHQLASAFDEVMRRHFANYNGADPW
jgi:hypothetical protein